MEQMQSYVGDAICDGAALEWEYKKPLEGLTEETLREMTSEDLERVELQRMEYNAYKVCEEVGYRIDGATAPGGYLKGYISKKPHEQFFTDQHHLLKYINSADSKKLLVPEGN